jgi:hypothetical protein
MPSAQKNVTITFRITIDEHAAWVARDAVEKVVPALRTRA